MALSARPGVVGRPEARLLGVLRVSLVSVVEHVRGGVQVQQDRQQRLGLGLGETAFADSGAQRVLVWSAVDAPDTVLMGLALS